MDDISHLPEELYVCLSLFQTLNDLILSQVTYYIHLSLHFYAHDVRILFGVGVHGTKDLEVSIRLAMTNRGGGVVVTEGRRLDMHFYTCSLCIGRSHILLYLLFNETLPFHRGIDRKKISSD